MHKEIKVVQLITNTFSIIRHKGSDKVSNSLSVRGHKDQTCFDYSLSTILLNVIKKEVNTKICRIHFSTNVCVRALKASCIRLDPVEMRCHHNHHTHLHTHTTVFVCIFAKRHQTVNPFCLIHKTILPPSLPSLDTDNMVDQTKVETSEAKAFELEKKVKYTHYCT